MKLSDFKIRRNKQRPDFCYSYERITIDKKYTIFTMNGGVTFLASLEEKMLDDSYSSSFSQSYASVNECLSALSDK